MTEEEKIYQQQLEASGVELDEVDDAGDEGDKPEEPEKEPEVASTEKEDDEPEDKDEHLQDKPKGPAKPRSIYDDYKDKKSEAKIEKERADKAEGEVAVLRAKVQELSDAKPGRETKDAEKDLRTFAIEKGADPDLIDRIVAEAKKGAPQAQLDETLKQDLAEFKEWKKGNASAIEQREFDREFKTLVPSLKTQFPTATEAELDAIKAKLDTVSHTKEWHDKSLDYVAFKHQAELAALVSPKKRGMEGKGKQDVDVVEGDFDPNADLSTMTPKQRQAWETTYRQSGKRTELSTGKDGRKLFV